MHVSIETGLPCALRFWSRRKAAEKRPHAGVYSFVHRGRSKSQNVPPSLPQVEVQVGTSAPSPRILS